mmetsp:Transcript_24592/g.80394  ORF Transcript_24592/g.80394 Transcript_24592/m.80394 type:complete len:202 (-) Transcript_24592:526-1131(-)
MKTLFSCLARASRKRRSDPTSSWSGLSTARSFSTSSIACSCMMRAMALALLTLRHDSKALKSCECIIRRIVRPTVRSMAPRDRSAIALWVDSSASSCFSFAWSARSFSSKSALRKSSTTWRHLLNACERPLFIIFRTAARCARSAIMRRCPVRLLSTALRCHNSKAFASVPLSIRRATRSPMRLSLDHACSAAWRHSRSSS